MYIPEDYVKAAAAQVNGPSDSPLDSRNSLLILLTSLYLGLLLLLLGCLLVLTWWQPLSQRLHTLFLTTFTLLMPTCILVSCYDLTWLVATETFRTPSATNGTSHVTVSFGLTTASIDLTESVDGVSEVQMYHLHLSLDTLDEARTTHRKALVSGYPQLLLTITDYLCMDVPPHFAWFRYYRNAGYYANILVWCAFLFWMVGLLLVTIVFRHGCLCMIVCGALLVAAVLVYQTLLPPNSLSILLLSSGDEISAQISLDNVGASCYISFSVGVLCFTIGAIMLVYNAYRPNSLSVSLNFAEKLAYQRHLTMVIKTNTDDDDKSLN